MGLFSSGSSKPKIRYVAPQFTSEARESLDVLYPAIERGLAGGGLTPEIDAATRSRMLESLRTEFPETRRELGSQIARTIPRADLGVRGFLKKSLDAQFAREKEDIGREFEFKGFGDIETSQNLAFGALSSELGLASNYADIMNQSTMRREQAPRFGDELAGGLGTAAGWYAAGGGFSGTGGADTFSPNNVKFGQNLDPGFTGSNYLSNFSSADFRPPAVHYANQFAESYPR